MDQMFFIFNVLRLVENAFLRNSLLLVLHNLIFVMETVQNLPHHILLTLLLEDD